MQRRDFLRSAAIATTALATRASFANSANDRISVCVMGVRGRGGALLRTFAEMPDVDVKYVCDLDPGVLNAALGRVEDMTGKRPQGIKDFRTALDDNSVDALVNGGPDHWHALPTIFACQAGKDVYVEKPDSHNILEGRTMVAAAKKYNRIVQLGTQARNGELQHAAMEYLQKQPLGKVMFAKAWESARQGSIGNPPDSDPPQGVDYDMWLGPAPKRPFNIRRYHGSWRWFFDYGTGDLGNDGVHRLDVARWALETAHVAHGGQPLGMPDSVSAHGGKFYFDDMQQWPDTLQVTYQYRQHVLTYEMRLWSPYPMLGDPEGAAVFGENGYVVIGNRRWRAYDRRGQLIKEETGSDNTTGHVRDFLDCMRERTKKPKADLETVGHPSSLLCHLGNAAWRAGRTLRFDPTTYTFKDDEDANRWLTRETYREPWTLPKIREI